MKNWFCAGWNAVLDVLNEHIDNTDRQCEAVYNLGLEASQYPPAYNQGIIAAFDTWNVNDVIPAKKTVTIH
jgi:hypothetical protein